MEVEHLLGEWNTDEWDLEVSGSVTPTEAARAYIDNLTKDSGLQLRKPEETQAAYNAHGEKGLFGLFVSEKLKKAWRMWTNTKLVNKGDTPVTVAELDAYIGLEMAMSLIPITDIKELWSEKPFQGHPEFKATMGRNRFQSIRASLQVHPPYDNDGDGTDTAEASDTEKERNSVTASAISSGIQQSQPHLAINDSVVGAQVAPPIGVANGMESFGVATYDKPTNWEATAALPRVDPANAVGNTEPSAVVVGLGTNGMTIGADPNSVVADVATTGVEMIGSGPTIDTSYLMACAAPTRVASTGNRIGVVATDGEQMEEGLTGAMVMNGAIGSPSRGGELHSARRERFTDEAEARRDPLRHSRLLLEHFQAKFSSLAVPIGVSSVDEISVRTKARTLAKTFMPLKPDKFAIRFYAVVGWRSLYIHALWDNGSGNTTATTPAERYTRLFPRLRQPLYNVLNQGEVHVDPKTPSALWLAMIAHQTLLLPAENGRRLLVSDNFYTRHTLAKAVLAITDGETRMLGTVRQDWIGSLNKDAVADSIARVKTKPRGSWELVAAVDSCLASKKDKAAHARKQKKVPAHLRTPYSPPVEFSPRAGFIVFLDKQPVVFYTNDLASTPTARVLDGTNSEAISCCHGLYPIQRWTTNRVLHREVLLVPAVVAAYNVAMNGVDRVDQLRSTNPTRRKEQRISMSIFTWLLDLSLINAFALMHHIQANAKAPRTLREFKRRVCESLTNAQRGKARSSSSKRRRSEPTPQHDTINSGLHVLTPNSSDHSSGKLVCHLCSMRGTKTSKSRFGCTGCLVGYHVGCFAVAHYKDAFHTTTPSVAAALQVIQDAENGNPASQTRRRHNNTITPLEKLELQN